MSVVQITEPCSGHDDPSRALLLRSVADYYGAEAIEFLPGMSPRQQPGGSEDGAWMDCVGQVRCELRRRRPRVVIIRGARLLPALVGLRHLPAMTIYDAIDCSPFHDSWTAKMAQGTVVKVDLALYREELSAAAEMECCRRIGVASRIVYPCAALPSDPNDTVPVAARRPVIRFDETSVFERLASESPASRASDLPIEFGDAPCEPGSPLPADWRQAAFRFVGREPCCEYGRHVAPPAFFASIAAGVPVVAAPHRQLQEFVGRYGCGIVMDAWTPEAFRRAAGTALELCRTAAYDELVANCRRACERELNWATQFGKLAGVLPAL